MNLSRTGWTLSGLALASVLMMTSEVDSSLAAAHQGDSFPAVLLALGTLFQVTMSGWILAIAGLTLLGGSSRQLRYVAPRLMRRAMFAGAAGALTFVPSHGTPPLEPVDVSPYSLDGLRLPDRPSITPPHPADTVRRTSIIVRSGDTLWAIAARSLPVDATNAQIATAASAWHSANRAVIGPNPHRIFPGQQFTQPTGKDPS